MKTCDPDAIPVKVEKIPSQEVEDEIFAITPDDGMLHNINEMGSLIWNLINGRRRIADIEVKLLSEYEVDTLTLQKDLFTFFNKLHQKGLIEYKR